MRSSLVRLVVLAALAALPLRASAVHASAAAEKPAPYRVEVTGKGPAMILIPGLASSGETWNALVAHYAKRHTCHVFTLAGFAGVPAVEGPFLATAKAAVMDYIRAERLVRPVIVGHSLGGVLALDLAASDSTLAGPLVIVDALPFLGGTMDPKATPETIRPQAEMMRNAIAGQTREAYRRFVETSPMYAGMATDSLDIARIRAWGRDSDPVAVANGMYDVQVTDLREALPRIAQPMLVLGAWYGMKDFTTRENVETLYRAQYAGARDWRFALAEKAKHFIMLDEPQWTIAQMDEFLAEKAVAGRSGGRR